MNDENLGTVAPSEQSPVPAAAVQKIGLPKISSLFSEGWKLYKSRLKTSIQIQLLVFALLAIGAILVGLGVLLSKSVDQNVLFIIALVFAIPFVIAMVYLSIWVQASQIMIYNVSDEEAKVKTVLNKSKPFLLQFFWVSLLSGLIVMGGSILFLIPGIILMVMVAFSTYVAVLEGRKNLDAVLASREYVRGIWWPLFGRGLLIMLIYLAVSIAFSILSGIFDEIFKGLGSVVSLAVSLLLTPLLVGLIFTLYKQVKALKGEISIPATGRGKYIALAVFGALVITVALITSIGLLALNAARQEANDFHKYQNLNNPGIEIQGQYLPPEINIEDLEQPADPDLQVQ